MASSSIYLSCIISSYYFLDVIMLCNPFIYIYIYIYIWRLYSWQNIHPNGPQGVAQWAGDHTS
jgi:hypothetical protein